MKEKYFDTEQLRELFEKHWKLKPHFCQSCGVILKGPNKTYYHDHLLEKSKYPEFALEMDNLWLVCQACHSFKSNGFPTNPHRHAIEIAELKFIIKPKIKPKNE